MPTSQKATDQELLEALKRHGSVRGAARELGLDPATIRWRKRRLVERGAVIEPYAPEPDGFGVHGLTTLVRGDGSVALQWVKSSQDQAAREKLILESVEALKESLPKLARRPATKGAKYNRDIMACYPIGDAHIGMQAWAEECGANWDLKIAERVQCTAMADLVARAPPAEQAVIINLGDFMHYDSMIPVTPRSGNYLDADGRPAKMMRVAIKVLRQCIESALDRHKTVRVINSSGNHDPTAALWLSAALSHIYEHEPRVTVDTSPALFHYFEFGKCLVGIHHGHACKLPQLPGVMAADQAEAWGRTKYRYWWTGHVHHQSIMEYQGVAVETFNTLASKDAYATSGGWRARENMKCIILHREFGEIARHTTHPAMYYTQEVES